MLYYMYKFFDKQSESFLESECVMNVMTVSSETKDIDLTAYVVKDVLTKQYFHLEDCVALFQCKESAEAYIKDDTVVSIHERKTQPEIVEVKLTTELSFDNQELYYVALNEDNSIVADEDLFLYVYYNLHDLMQYDRNKFVVAQIIEK